MLAWVPVWCYSEGPVTVSSEASLLVFDYQAWELTCSPLGLKHSNQRQPKKVFELFSIACFFFGLLSKKWAFSIEWNYYNSISIERLIGLKWSAWLDYQALRRFAPNLSRCWKFRPVTKYLFGSRFEIFEAVTRFSNFGHFRESRSFLLSTRPSDKSGRFLSCEGSFEKGLRRYF